ncbi:MAG: hypothetical protein V2A73_13215 [Pseudomonadota bacterium]
MTVANSAPTGSVGGVLVDAATMAPLAGVQLSLLAGGKAFPPVTTSADGSFAFDKVPAGTVLLLVAASSQHHGATLSTVVPGAVGEFPTGNQAVTLGPIGLLPNGGAFRFRVLGSTGRPVVGYQASVQLGVEWVDFSSGEPVEIGRRMLSATATDADGYSDVSGLPDFFALGETVSDALAILLPPLDADKDGDYEYAGGVRAFSMRALGQPVPDVVLDPGYDTSLKIVASTIPSLAGKGTAPAVIGPSDQLFVKFNLPIENSSRVWVYGEDGAPMAPTVTVTGTLLSVSVTGLQQGAEYNLQVHAVASVGNHALSVDAAAPFFTRPGAEQVSIVTNERTCAGVIELVLNEPIGGVPGDLSGRECVIFYGIDLDQSGETGDSAGEIGHDSCVAGHTLSRDEPTQPGMGGLSGYTSHWRFTPPKIGAAVIPEGTPIQFLFSRIPDAGYIPKRVDGRAVVDMSFLAPKVPACP